MAEDEVQGNEETEVETKAEPVVQKGVISLLQEVVGEERVTNEELERVIYSGDPGGLPQYHYRCLTLSCT